MLKSMKMNLVLVSTVIAMQCPNLYAMGKPKPAPAPFDYAAMSGHFKPVAPCSEQPFDLVADPVNHKVQLIISDPAHPPTGGVQIEYSPFENINEGKREFNSCFSDGVLGYRITVGSGTRIEQTVIYLKPGFMCQGKAEKDRVVETLELEGDLLTHTISSTLSKSGSICVYERK
jgi:hypothetical protein